MAVNIPVNTGGVILNGNGALISITGSFGGMLALQTGSVLSPTSSVQIAGLKYIVGTNASGYPLESGQIGSFNLSSGTKLELAITSCSLAAGSAPVFLYF